MWLAEIIGRVICHDIYEPPSCHQPPPILPRRGGTDTLASNIIVSSRLIISGLSKAIVSVPPLRGRLGGGWYDCLKKSLTKHSNLFLPFGNVRMGYPTGKVWMGSRPRGGWCHQTCSHFLSLYLRFIARYVCELVTHSHHRLSVSGFRVESFLS